MSLATSSTDTIHWPVEYVQACCTMVQAILEPQQLSINIFHGCLPGYMAIDMAHRYVKYKMAHTMTSPTVAKAAPLGIMFVRISTASISTRTRAPMHKVTYWNRRNSIGQWFADICRLPTWNRMKNATMGRTTATISTGPRRFGINPRTRTGANQMIAGSAPSHIAIRTIHARVSAAVNITDALPLGRTLSLPSAFCLCDPILPRPIFVSTMLSRTSLRTCYHIGVNLASIIAWAENRGLRPFG